MVHKKQSVGAGHYACVIVALVHDALLELMVTLMFGINMTQTTSHGCGHSGDEPKQRSILQTTKL